ncbi:MAG: polysaccharide biosynthesis C-terminal domain-containing protein [Candidatus Aegiribacteria sp.]|nr:polysaccharide biosynthesis C-terminal domain-containing protein [Candidatus Aegiribacteria sp.]
MVILREEQRQWFLPYVFREPSCCTTYFYQADRNSKSIRNRLENRCLCRCSCVTPADKGSYRPHDFFSTIAIRKNRESSSEFLSRIINWITIAGLILCAVLFLYSGNLASLIGPGLKNIQTDMTSSMLKILVPVVLLSSLSGVLQGVCNYQRRFGLTAILRLVEISASLIVVFLFSRTMGIFALPLSVLTGSTILFLTLIFISNRLQLNYRPVFSVTDPDFKKFFKMALPVIVGALAISAAPVADKFMASFLQEDSITSLDYANRILNILLVILFLPMATVANVAFSEHTAKHDRPAFKVEIRNLFGWTSCIVLPATTAIIALSVPLVSILFQRGEFTSTDSQTVGKALLFYAPWLTSFSICTLVGRAFYAMKDSITPIVLGIWGMIANILLNVTLIGPMGIGGLALGTSLASAAKAVLLVYFLRKRIGGIHGKDLIREHIKIIISCAAMVFVMILLQRLIPFDINGDFSGRLLCVLVYTVMGVIVYGSTMLAVKSIPARSVLSGFTERFRN